ncbi:unnamed protein product [Cunninghamella blakesleeana]
MDVHDEIDLPDLAGLDLNDSKEDFWKLDKNLPDYQTLLKQSPKDHRNTNNVSTVKDIDFIGSIKNHPELDSPQLSWSPADDHIETLSPIIHTTHTNTPPTAINTNTAGIITSSRPRSGSINSENSLNSYSTITTSNQYARYGMTPMIYQSDSTSTSSRTPSRLSNYSTSSQTSSNTTTGLPRPRKVSANSNGMPSPSRSITTNNNSHTNMSMNNGGNGNNGNSNNSNISNNNNNSHRNGGRDLNTDDNQQFLPRAHSRLGSTHHHNNTGSSTTRSKLAQRASHIPSPSSGLANKSLNNNSNNNSNNKPLPRLTSIPSSRSTGLTGTRTASRLGGDINNTNANTSSITSTQRNLKSRASHIPSIYERSASPNGGNNNNSGRHSSASTIRNSVFGFRRDDSSSTTSSTPHHTSSSIPSSSNHLSRNRTRSNDHRVTSPTNLKTSHIPSPPSVRSQSRIGIRKG